MNFLLAKAFCAMISTAGREDLLNLTRDPNKNREQNLILRDEFSARKSFLRDEFHSRQKGCVTVSYENTVRRAENMK